MRLEADDGRPETSPPLRRGVQTADRAVVRERQAIPEDPPSWPDILRTIELGYSNARLEASDNRIKVTIRMAYGFQPREQPHRTRHAPLRRQSWRKRQSRHAVIDIPPFNGIVITCALLKRMDRARSSAG